jgi:predicted  nucleic acid-binding Zn-ribbon protein
MSYSRSGEIPKDVRDAIGKAIAMKQALIDLEQQMNAGSQQISAISVEQTRIRENMKTISPSTPYYERLLTKLNDQESSIERLQAQRVDLMSKRDQLQKELEAYLQGLSVG